jgi:hypothetical protein
MPILSIYRRTSDHPDGLAEQLVSAEAAHAVIPPHGRQAGVTIQTLRTVVEYLAQHFGTFLVVEIWSPLPSEASPLTNPNGEGEPLKPRFEVLAPASRIPRATVEAMAMAKSLGKEVLPYGGTRIVLGQYGSIAPPGMKPLLRLNEVKQWNCYTLGLVVRPVDRRETTLESEPDTVRAIARTVHAALDHAYSTDNWRQSTAPSTCCCRPRR